jgi:anthranilate/para-aminobenzoate synthase component II
MAIQHKKLPIFGVQFHPESIGFNENYRKWGMKILENFLRIAQNYKKPIAVK